MGGYYVDEELISPPLGGSRGTAGNGSQSDYDYLPPLELPLVSQITLITLYTLTALASLLGNGLVIMVLCFGRRNYSNLSRYLVNLALSDLTMVVFCIPFTFTETMLGHWVFGKAMCPLAQFMQVLSVGVSIFTNTAIGIDRYFAVVHPLKQRVTKTRTMSVIFATWFLSFSIAVVMLIVGRASSFLYNKDILYECSEHWPSRNQARSYTVFLLILTYLAPLFILTFTYYRICVILWRRQPPGNADESRDRNHIASKRKVTKMLIILVLVFALCWLPLHAFTLAVEIAPYILRLKTTAQERTFYALFYTAHWLAMASSFTNPVVYCFLNEDFMVSLKCYFYRCLHNCGRTSHMNSIHHQREIQRLASFNCSVTTTCVLPQTGTFGTRL